MNLLHAMAVLGYLPKLEMGLGLAFGANLMHDFSMNMFLIYYSIYVQIFNTIPLLLFQDIKQNVL